MDILGLLQAIMNAYPLHPDEQGLIPMNQVRGLARDPGALPGVGTMMNPRPQNIQELLRWLERNTDVAKYPPQAIAEGFRGSLRVNPQMSGPPGRAAYVADPIKPSLPGTKADQVPVGSIGLDDPVGLLRILRRALYRRPSVGGIEG